MGDEEKRIKIEFFSGSKLAPTRGGLGVWCAEVEDVAEAAMHDTDSIGCVSDLVTGSGCVCAL